MVIVISLFFFYVSGDHRDLHVLTHSFPTRLSSELAKAGAAGGSAPTPAAAAGGTELPSRSAGATDKGERVKASPLAKRLADERGIDLKTLTGSGPGGRLVKGSEERRVGKEGAVRVDLGGRRIIKNKTENKRS